MPIPPKRKSKKGSAKEVKTQQRQKYFDNSFRGTSIGSMAAPCYWYERDPAEMYGDIFSRVREIQDRQLLRRYEMAVWQSLYNNTSYLYLASGNLFAPYNTGHPGGFARVSANIIAGCVDTWASRIIKTKPRITILPNKGDYRLVKKAEDLTDFLDGACVSSGLYEQSETVGRDAALHGSCGMYLGVRHGQPYARAIKPDELIIDVVDGQYDEPREMFYVHTYSTQEAYSLFPKTESGEDSLPYLMQARNAWRGDMAFMTTFDRVKVVEVWHLPSSPTAGDGLHVVCISGATLVAEEWKKDYIPVARYHCIRPSYGPWGTGFGAKLFGLQRQLTDMMEDISKSIDRFAKPRLIVSKQSGLSQHSFVNDISVMAVNGSPQEAVYPLVPQAMSNDVFSYVQWIYDLAWKEVGLSQLSGTSEKPEGLDSGKALRTYQNIETERFSLQGQAWERFFIQCGTILIDLCADEYSKGNNISINVPGGSFIKQVDWKNAKLAKDQYSLAAYPTNLLSNTPEGRLQDVDDLTRSGFMPKDVALKQLRIPILYDWIDAETAFRDLIHKSLSKILDDGKYVAPDGIGNIDLAVQMSQVAWTQAQIDEVEPNKQDLLLRYMNRALQLQQQKQAAMMPPQQAPQATPQVGTAATPPPSPLAPAGSGPVSLPPAA